MSAVLRPGVWEKEKPFFGRAAFLMWIIFLT